MDTLYERCCGIDVHKKLIVACLRCGTKQELRQYGSTSEELRALTKWLLSKDCQMAAMESTGSYWKPLYNIFELSGLKAMVVNARDMRNVPGRKTDAKDAEWIADLLQHGLLKASFIPGREQRELREASRYRKSLIEERARELNRLQKMLEGGNIKLASVVSDINGRSARKLLAALLGATQPLTEEEVQGMVHGPLKHKAKAILKAVDGFLTPLQKELVRQVVDHIDDMTERIGKMDEIMEQYLGEYQEAINRRASGRREAERRDHSCRNRAGHDALPDGETNFQLVRPGTGEQRERGETAGRQDDEGESDVEDHTDPMRQGGRKEHKIVLPCAIPKDSCPKGEKPCHGGGCSFHADSYLPHTERPCAFP